MKPTLPILTVAALLSFPAAVPVSMGAAQDGAPAAVPATGPQMVFERERETFGKVLDTELQTVKFKFRNAGGADLRLGQVKTNIDTVIFIDSSKRSFAPGESGELVFQVDPSRWRGQVGTVVSVHSNSPGRPIELTIEGLVEQTVEIKPRVAAFGWLKPDQKPLQRLSVIGRTPDFAVTSAKTESLTNGFRVVVGEPAEFEINGEKFRRVSIEIVSDKQMPDGHIADTLEIMTTDARKSLIRVPVTGWIGLEPPPPVSMPPTFTHEGKVLDAKPVTPKDLPQPNDVKRPDPAPAPAPKAP